jgi:hypothetical protein
VQFAAGIMSYFLFHGIKLCPHKFDIDKWGAVIYANQLVLMMRVEKETYLFYHCQLV